jgi:hypothetical protein
MTHNLELWETYSSKITSEYLIAKARGVDIQYVTDWTNYIQKTHPRDVFKYMREMYELLDRLSRGLPDTPPSMPHVSNIHGDKIVIALDHVSYGRLVDLTNKQEERRRREREERARSRGASVEEIKPYKLPITWERIS